MVATRDTASTPRAPTGPRRARRSRTRRPARRGPSSGSPLGRHARAGTAPRMPEVAGRGRCPWRSGPARRRPPGRSSEGRVLVVPAAREALVPTVTTADGTISSGAQLVGRTAPVEAPGEQACCRGTPRPARTNVAPCRAACEAVAVPGVESEDTSAVMLASWRLHEGPPTQARAGARLVAVPAHSGTAESSRKRRPPSSAATGATAASLGRSSTASTHFRAAS